MLHDDVSPQHPEWLDAMLELATRPWVGLVGAKLFDAAGALQHIGLVLGLGGLAGRPFAGHARDTVGYFSNAICIRNCAAVSGACVMTPKAVFDQVGGLDDTPAGRQRRGGLRPARVGDRAARRGHALRATHPCADRRRVRRAARRRRLAASAGAVGLAARGRSVLQPTSQSPGPRLPDRLTSPGEAAGYGTTTTTVFDSALEPSAPVATIVTW